MFNWLFNLFQNKEKKITEQVIRDNEEYQKKLDSERPENIIPASVIRYIISEEESGPDIEILVDDFHGPLLPEPGTIIWIYDEETRTTRPYKTVRFDFFESDDEYERSRVYIVVEGAMSSDIVPNPKYINS